MIQFRWLSLGSKGICSLPKAGEGFDEETTPNGNFLKTGAGNSLHVASQMTRKCSIRMYPWLNVLAVFRLTILNPTETLILHACSRVDRATQSMTLTNEAQYSIGYRDFVVKTLLSFSTTWGWEEFRNIINDFKRAV